LFRDSCHELESRRRGLEKPVSIGLANIG
jgi:hypothetical protein